MWGARKKYPSLPSNYISIIQLKERWMREQDEQQKKEQEEKGDLNKHGEEKEGSENEIVSGVVAPPQSQIHPKRNKYGWVVKVRSQKPQGPESGKDHGEIKVRAHKQQELKIKDDCRRVDTRRKPRAGGTYLQVWRNRSEQKSPGRVDEMGRMYRRMEKLSMNPEKIGGSRITTDPSGHQRNSAYYQHRAVGGLTWVRKGESSGSASQS